jgi:hypothetical protein
MCRNVLVVIALAGECIFGQSTARGPSRVVKHTKIGKYWIEENFEEWRKQEPRANELDKDATRCPGRRFSTGYGNRIYQFCFMGEVLSSVTVTPNREDTQQTFSFHDEVDLLTQVYGKPSKIDRTPYQNGYGARWESSIVAWNMPDGTRIVAIEFSSFEHHGELLFVAFDSKEYLSKKSENRSTPNPYEQ